MSTNKRTDNPWNGKISHHSQIGGIETSTVDNGPARGNRIAWVNTGTGLRYKVVIDRGMDIVDAFYNQHSLAWLSHGGNMSPESYAYKGIDWLKTFSGGLMTTCGLTHVGGPEVDEFGERGLHDQISNIPADLESVIQPDPIHGKLEMSISGEMKQTQVFGSRLDFKRKISGELGSSIIKVTDQVINSGNEPAPHMILYHLNFGWPLIDEGAKILWKGKCESRGRAMDDYLFSPGMDYKTCKGPLEAHNGTGEACGFIDPEADKDGIVHCGVFNPKIDLGLAIRFKKDQMPWITNWQHWGKNEYVTAIEPGTHPPIGQSEARKEGSLIFLEPGEHRVYELELEVLSNREKINQLITKTE
ncbi:MAG: aldose 1-epimerase family protein [Bacteroidota bacterium]